jgi:3-deoxy-D-manno-octulosonic-acid transferase
VLILYDLLQALAHPSARVPHVELSITDGILSHASSVGEVTGAFPLLDHIQERHPDLPLMLSVYTRTGRERASRLLEGRKAQAIRFPADRRGVMDDWVRRLRPRLALIFETELWPNFLRALHRGNVPVYLVNARLTPRTLRRYGAARGLVRGSLNCLTGILAQTEADRRRFLWLGARPERVRVLGSLKYDAMPKASGSIDRKALGYGGEDVILTFGSLRSLEEDPVLWAVSELRTKFPDVRFVLAPRHPERVPPLRDKLEALGIPNVLRSEGESPEKRILILDTLGELGDFYALSDLAFVGGTLGPYGGHNLIEPAARGLPVVFGPHHENVLDTARELLRAGGGVLVQDEASLRSVLEDFLARKDRREEAGRRAREFVESRRGVVERTYRAISRWL